MMSQFSSSSVSSVPESQSSCGSSVSLNSEKIKDDVYDCINYETSENNDVNSLIHLTSIDSLHPSRGDWTIKAQVVSISDVKIFVDRPRVKKLSVVNLADGSGTIRATLFNETNDLFHDLLEKHKVYYISNCSVTLSDKRYTTINHDFGLNFEVQTIVKLCEESDDIVPLITFDFVPLQAITDITPNSFIDVIGIVKSVEEIQHIESTEDERTWSLREFELVDPSNKTVTVTIWCTQAEEFYATPHSVLAIKAAKVPENYGSRNITFSSMQSILQMNPPNLSETQLLKHWFIKSLNSTSDELIIDERRNRFWTLKEIFIHHLERRIVNCFSVIATVIGIAVSDKPIYQACPRKSCGEKVIHKGEGIYWCEKCKNNIDTFEYRNLQVQISDWTMNYCVTMLSDQAEAFLGVKLEKISDIPNAINSVFRTHLYKTYIFEVETTMVNDQLEMIVKNRRLVDYQELFKTYV